MANEQEIKLTLSVAALPPLPGERQADGSIYLGTLPAGSIVGPLDPALGGWPVTHPDHPPRLITPFGIAEKAGGMWTVTRSVFAEGATISIGQAPTDG